MVCVISDVCVIIVINDVCDISDALLVISVEITAKQAVIDKHDKEVDALTV